MQIKIGRIIMAAKTPQLINKSTSLAKQFKLFNLLYAESEFKLRFEAVAYADSGLGPSIQFYL